MKNKLFIISNEKIFKENENFYCDNIDIKSIPEELDKKFDVTLIGRKSKERRAKHINIKDIKVSKNYLNSLRLISQTIKSQNRKYLVISISPFTFISIIYLKLLRQKVFLYLRSDGFEEYKSILGFFGPWVYGLMFFISSKFTKLIACRSRILKGKKGVLVNPSQLNHKWHENYKPPNLDKIKLLYVGRLRVEKGIFSLFEIIKKTSFDLTVVTSEIKLNVKNEFSNINLISYKNTEDSIIKFYDECNIFILPSYTEAHPQVLDEALARLRPVIIFKEISHVERDRKGIFVTGRNQISLEDKINYIKENYFKIQEEMKFNKLPSKKNFIKQLENILF